MCVCAHACMYVCMQVRTRAFLYPLVDVCANVQMTFDMCISWFIYIYKCREAGVCVHVSVYVYVLCVCIACIYICL